MNILNEKIDDRVLLISSSFLGVIGWVLFTDFSYKEISPVAFYFGFILISLEFPMARNAAFAIFSKIIGPYPAGRYMGFMLASGCLSRAISPFWAIQSMKISIKVCAFSCCLALIICIFIIAVYWKNCSPHPENVKSSLVIIDVNCIDSFTQPLVSSYYNE
jgi:hypothetical protein